MAHLGVAERITAAASPESPYSAVDPKRGLAANVRHHPAAISATVSPSKAVPCPSEPPFAPTGGSALPSIRLSAAASSSGMTLGPSGRRLIAFSEVFTCAKGVPKKVS